MKELKDIIDELNKALKGKTLSFFRDDNDSEPSTMVINEVKIKYDSCLIFCGPDFSIVFFGPMQACSVVDEKKSESPLGGEVLETVSVFGISLADIIRVFQLIL